MVRRVCYPRQRLLAENDAQTRINKCLSLNFQKVTLSIFLYLRSDLRDYSINIDSNAVLLGGRGRGVGLVKKKLQ